MSRQIDAEWRLMNVSKSSTVQKWKKTIKGSEMIRLFLLELTSVKKKKKKLGWTCTRGADYAINFTCIYVHYTTWKSLACTRDNNHRQLELRFIKRSRFVVEYTRTRFLWDFSLDFIILLFRPFEQNERDTRNDMDHHLIFHSGKKKNMFCFKYFFFFSWIA